MSSDAYEAGQKMAHEHAPYFREAPLSGELAGESMPEIAHQYGIVEDAYGEPAVDWADDFEEGYYSVSEQWRQGELDDGLVPMDFMDSVEDDFISEQ